jgi:hypothetical protein
LADADSKLKSKLYEELGMRITYDHATRIVIAGAKVSVGGGDLNPHALAGTSPSSHDDAAGRVRLSCSFGVRLDTP